MEGKEKEMWVIVWKELKRIEVEIEKIVDSEEILVLGIEIIGLKGEGRRRNEIEMLIELIIGNVEELKGKGDIGEVIEIDWRKKLIVKREKEIGIEVEKIIGLFLVLRNDELRMGRRILVELGKDGKRRIVEDLVEDIGNEGIEVNIEKVRSRKIERKEEVDEGEEERGLEKIREIGLKIKGRKKEFDIEIKKLIESLGKMNVKKLNYCNCKEVKGLYEL